jgi:hypothetical protein
MKLKIPRNEIRNIRLTANLSKLENDLLNELSKKNDISRTEMIVRALEKYQNEK